MRDNVHNMRVVTAIGPAVQSAAVTGGAIDLQGFESVTAVVQTGAIASAGDFGLKLQHSDTTTSGDFTDVDGGDLMGSFSSTLEADSVEKVGYRGNKRYLRAVMTKAGGTSIAAGVVFIQAHAAELPVV